MSTKYQEKGAHLNDHVEQLSDDEYPRRKSSAQLPTFMSGVSQADQDKMYSKAIMKMDLIILPILVIMYILNYLDRQNIAAAKLAGIDKSLKLTGVQYQTCISILFVGYILMQVPSNMLLGKIKYPGIYISCMMALWGVVSACMGAVNSYTHLVLARFGIGVVEAVFFPGALFYLSMFYSRKQYAFRAAILYSGSQLGNAFGGLFAIAILKLEGKHGIEGWRWLFIIEGVATVGLGLIFAFILPNSPASIKVLNKEEKALVLYRYELDQGQKDNDSDEVSAGKGFMMAVSDPKTWLLMATLYCIYIAAAVTNFFPSVVATLGYSRTKTYGLTAPPYVLCVFVMMVNGFWSDKRKSRYLHIVIPLCITVVANVIAVSTLHTAPRYLAMMLMPASFYSASTVLLSWITGSLAQPKIKRASAIALINAVCNTPNIWTSYLYFGKPRYLTAFGVNLAAAVVAIALATLTRFYLQRQNKKFDRNEIESKGGPTAQQLASGFRYQI